MRSELLSRLFTAGARFKKEKKKTPKANNYAVTEAQACNEHDDEGVHTKWMPDLFLPYVIALLPFVRFSLVLFLKIHLALCDENNLFERIYSAHYSSSRTASMKFTFGIHVHLYVVSNCQLFEGKSTATIKTKKNILWVMLETMSFCGFHAR